MAISPVSDGDLTRSYHMEPVFPILPPVREGGYGQNYRTSNRVWIGYNIPNPLPQIHALTLAPAPSASFNYIYTNDSLYLQTYPLTKKIFNEGQMNEVEFSY